jgi:hypothetical protein
VQKRAVVKGLCTDAEMRLTKVDFIKLAYATAKILLAASGADGIGRLSWST